MQSINKLMGVGIFLIFLYVAIIPIVQDAITEANFSGTLKTVTDNVPTFLGLAGLATAAYTIAGRD